MNDLDDLFMLTYLEQQRKHDKGVDWAEKYVNNMTNVEFLHALSYHLNLFMKLRGL